VILRADARFVPLREACVDCVVTSPPYWGLRDYGDGQQIGLEVTPALYVAALVSVFREIWRVLRPDGTLWLNLGDCYATGGGRVGECPGGGKQGESWKLRGVMTPPNRMPLPGLKSKDLVGIPWRVAFALQAAGWYLRSDIIWSKPNPMPESVTDRPTKSHEYVFLLAKSELYHYDAEAIAEPVSAAMVEQLQRGYNGHGTKDYAAAGVQNPSDVKTRIVSRSRNKARKYRGEHGGNPALANTHQGFGVPWEGSTRNKRSVWSIGTQPYAGAHFATMPEALVRPCILAGCPLGGLVLDPFLGSGTVGAVAEQLGRRWVGLDLRYQALAKARTAQRGLRF
jgi:DNA modification methylase